MEIPNIQKNKTSWNFGNPLPSIVRVQDTFMRSPQSCNNCTFTLGARVLMPMFNSTVFVGLKPTQRKNNCSHLIGDCFQQKMGRTGNFQDMASSTAPCHPRDPLTFCWRHTTSFFLLECPLISQTKQVGGLFEQETSSEKLKQKHCKPWIIVLILRALLFHCRSKL